MRGKIGSTLLIGMALGIAAYVGGQPLVKKMTKKKDTAFFKNIGCTIDSVINHMR